MPFNLFFVLISSCGSTEVLALPGLEKAVCQDGLEEWNVTASPHLLHIGISYTHVFVSFLKDVNLKMPRNNQLLHFAFREDKQWKLQQVPVGSRCLPIHSLSAL